MQSNTEISDYLTDVHRDWQDSRDAFPHNVYPTHYWPIPFFGNPRTALVATVGVNPSSDEFGPKRNWAEVERTKGWKERLKHYFTDDDRPAHDWFGPWHKGLALLDCSYEMGTAAHFDVSYRPTKAMLRNPNTNRREFRHMVERDVGWFFRLLPLCPKLRGLLVYGPIVRHNGEIESLAAFVCKSAPRHGFRVLPDGGLAQEADGGLRREWFLHEVASTEMGTVIERVAADLTQHQATLRRKIHSTA
jgi:hypothetical protein